MYVYAMPMDAVDLCRITENIVSRAEFKIS